jgi:hypothetical protein
VISDLRKYDVRKSQKRLGPQIANSQSATFSEGVRKSNNLFESVKLRIAICGTYILYAELIIC